MEYKVFIYIRMLYQYIMELKVCVYIMEYYAPLQKEEILACHITGERCASEVNQITKEQILYNST